MSDMTALTIAIVVLYSMGHWIGATLLAVWLAWGIVIEADDPLGVKRLLQGLRHYRDDRGAAK